MQMKNTVISWCVYVIVYFPKWFRLQNYANSSDAHWLGQISVCYVFVTKLLRRAVSLIFSASL